MLPSAEHFLEGIAFFARRRAPRWRLDPATMSAAIAEAERLSADREDDEPAALFYACARRSRAFGPLARDLLPFLLRRQAHLVDCEIDVEDIALDILRLRVLLGSITFDDLRAELSSRTRPRT